MAVQIRVLLHTNVSLIDLLGARSNVQLVSTLIESLPVGTQVYDGICELSAYSASPRLDLSKARTISVDDWWNEVAVINGIKDGQPLTHTRRTIVLGTSNKGGGAHYPDRIPESYKTLIEGIYEFQGDADPQPQPETDVQLVAVRVFAFELLNSPQLRLLA